MISEESKLKKLFVKYVSQNILAMVGLSLYILADSVFIAKANGAAGLAALNLVLPLYNLIFAIGAMAGVGSAIRYSIAKNAGKKESEYFFGNAIFFTAMISIIFIVAGLFFPENVLKFLGADSELIETGRTYTMIFMSFAPLFMWNHICTAFVRNDDAPQIAMAATLVSSLFNIVFDYVLMFPLGMGMPGAALATALSPLVGIGICIVHFRSAKSTVKLSFRGISTIRMFKSCQVGVSAFVGEISSGVITMAFNYIILTLAGNIGVAAYGVIANMSLIGVAVFNGVALGSQPLISAAYGKGEHENVSRLFRMAVITSIGLAAGILAIVFIGAESIIQMFNSENDPQMRAYAVTGLKIYFTGFIFAGINIIGGSSLSAVTQAGWACAVSVSRGFVTILACAFVLSALLRMTGIWMAFPAAEAITMLITAVAAGRTLILPAKLQRKYGIQLK